jgi:arylsulfatase A-like enzyme
VLFALTRPYTVFTVWHWQLTALLIAGFIVTGTVVGGVAGALVYFLGRAGVVKGNSRQSVESAAGLFLVVCFIPQVATWPSSFWGWTPLMLSSAGFTVLLTAATLRPHWRERTGFLLNPWIISGLLLGIGQEWSLLGMGLADQLASRVGNGARWWIAWMVLLGGILVAVAVGSVLLGRWMNRRRPHGRISSWGLLVASPVGALLLIAICSWLSVRPARVEAAVIPNPTGTNVLLIVMDTVHAAHLSVYGYDRKTTPNLEELARDSAVYPLATSASDFTLTGHASLFTGMYPSWHGSYCQPPDAPYGRQLATDYPTIAELLSRKGYRTLGVAANLYLRADFGLERGFSDFQIPRPVPVLPAENWYFLRRSIRRVLSYGFDTGEFDRLFSRSEDINRVFFSSLEQHPGDAPFFAFLNYMDAHYPYVPPAPFDHAYPGYSPHTTQDDLDRQQEDIAEGAPIPAGYRPHTISQYDGGIEYMDAQIGKVVRWLKQNNLYDRTMIIVTADHGESFGERHRIGHANSPYQNLLHVGLLVKYPNSTQKGVIQQPVSLVDVSPTILDTLGMTPPATMQGRSLAHGVPGPRELFGEVFECPVLHSPDCRNGCKASAIYSWPYKFITSTNGKRELYDLSADPNETRDLYAAMPDRSKQLNSDLNDWKKTAPSKTLQKRNLDPEMMRRLKSLGYAQ